MAYSSTRWDCTCSRGVVVVVTHGDSSILSLHTATTAFTLVLGLLQPTCPNHSFFDIFLFMFILRNVTFVVVVVVVLVIQELVENAFDILAARWRILLSPIRASVKNVEKYVCACLAQLFTANL